MASYTFKSGKKAGQTLEQVFQSGDYSFVKWVAENFSSAVVRAEAEKLLAKPTAKPAFDEPMPHKQVERKVTNEDIFFVSKRPGVLAYMFFSFQSDSLLQTKEFCHTRNIDLSEEERAVYRELREKTSPSQIEARLQIIRKSGLFTEMSREELQAFKNGLKAAGIIKSIAYQGNDYN